MVTSIVSLVPTTGTDIRAEIKNARLARDRVHALITLLETQRADASAALLKTISADFAALKDTPTKQFADAEYAKYTAWSTADQELEKRIDAFEALEPQIDAYVVTLATDHEDEFVALLKEERAALQLQLAKENADEVAVQARIDAVDEELAKYSGAYSSKSAASARRKTAKRAKSSTKRRTSAKKRGGRP